MATLIFLPGLACDAAMWRAQAAFFGGSRVAPVEEGAASVEEMAGALLAAFDGPLLLCGASMGGIVAMEAARQAPHRVRGLALLGTTARPETQEMRRLREDAIALFETGRAEEVLRANIPLAFAPRNAGNAALAQEYLGMIARAGTGQLVRQNRAIMARPDARLHLPHVACPVLVICGEADQLTPPECSGEIAALVPGSELVMLPECGHMLTMEEPDEVNRALAAWLARAGFDRLSPNGGGVS
ncbi:MAG: alpha/beta fold hydrolase [Burkholderiaceae bacterium]